MEAAVALSQGSSPALMVVSDEFWNALQAALPASGIPTIVTQGPAFQQSRQKSGSEGSSPMDTSSDGILAPAPHSPSLITVTLPILGASLNAPIILTSDSDTPHASPAPGPPGGHEAAEIICYGRSTVVSDLDGWGFVLNV
jgi:hypothetical protein